MMSKQIYRQDAKSAKKAKRLQNINLLREFNLFFRFSWRLGTLAVKSGGVI